MLHLYVIMIVGGTGNLHVRCQHLAEPVNLQQALPLSLSDMF